MSDAVGSLTVEIGAKIDGLTNALNSVQKQLETTKKNSEAWGASFTKVGKTLAVTGAAITAALTAVVVATANAGDEFDEMAAKTGISTEILSTLKLAADKSGTSIGSVAAGMKFLAAQMIEASTATDKGKTVLGALGISATDASGKLRPMNAVLFDVADRFAGMEAGALKTKLAVTIFGRAGMDMIPILDLGSAGLRANEEAARKLGIEWSGNSAKSASAFADALVDLKAANVGLGKTIGELLMPMVRDITEATTGAIVKIREWATANPELAQTLGSVALAVGMVSANVGAALIAIPALVRGFESLAATLAMSTGALGLAVAGLTALVAGAIIAYNTINNLTNAKDKANESDLVAFQRNEELGKKLRAVADAAGITRAEFVALTEKYDGNYAAMAMAIKKGAEGVDMQTALAKVSKEHSAAIDAQTAANNKLDPSLQAVLDSLDKTKKATENSTTIIETSVPSLRRFELGYWGINTALGETPIGKVHDFEDAILGVGKVIETALPAINKFPQAVMDMLPPVATVGVDWKKVADDISRAWKDSISQMLSGTTSFTDAISALWKSISTAIGSIVEDLVSTALKSLGAIAGPIGAIAGGIAAGLAQVIGNLLGFQTEAQKAEAAAKALANQLTQIKQTLGGLGEISDTTAEKFKKLRDQFGETVAMALTLADRMNDTGITMGNFSAYARQLNDILAAMDSGLLDAGRGVEAANAAFALLIDAAKKLGREGSSEIVAFILKAREMGMEIASVTAYVQEQLAKIPAALNTLVLGFDKVGGSIENLGVVALATFNAMINSGYTFAQAITALKEPLAALAQKYKDLGIAADPVLQRLLDVAGIVSANQELFDSIDAANEIMKALNNSAWLTQESFSALTGSVGTMYDKLIGSGLTGDEALKAMQPYLQTIYEMMIDNGYAVDDVTQGLIDQGLAAGLIKPPKLDPGEAAVVALDKIALILERMAEAMGIFVDDLNEGWNLLNTWPDWPELPEGGWDGSCFVAGTPILMADCSTKPIEAVRVGDSVMSWDTDRSDPIPAKVKEVFVHTPEQSPKLVCVNGSILATPEHPFWIDGAWINIGEAHVGSTLLNSCGYPVPIVSLEWIPGGVVTYNLHTDRDTHNYFAGGVLVHNKRLPDPTSEGIVPTGLAEGVKSLNALNAAVNALGESYTATSVKSAAVSKALSDAASILGGKTRAELTKSLYEMLAAYRDVLAAGEFTSSGQVTAAQKIAAAYKELGAQVPAEFQKIIDAADAVGKSVAKTYQISIAWSDAMQSLINGASVLGQKTKTELTQSLYGLIAAYRDVLAAGEFTASGQVAAAQKIAAVFKELGAQVPAEFQKITDAANNPLQGLIDAAQAFGLTLRTEAISSTDGMVKAYRELLAAGQFTAEGQVAAAKKIADAYKSLGFAVPYEFQKIIDASQPLITIADALKASANELGIVIKSELIRSLGGMEQAYADVMASGEFTAKSQLAAVEKIVSAYTWLGLTVPEQYQKIIDASKTVNDNARELGVTIRTQLLTELAAMEAAYKKVSAAGEFTEETRLAAVKRLIAAYKELGMIAPLEYTDLTGDTPAYATGGIAWTPQIATIAETGPEVIIPMADYNAGTGLAAGAGGGGGAGAGTVNTINLAIYAQTLDDATIQQASEKILSAIEWEQRRRGY